MGFKRDGVVHSRRLHVLNGYNVDERRGRHGCGATTGASPVPALRVAPAALALWAACGGQLSPGDPRRDAAADAPSADAAWSWGASDAGDGAAAHPRSLERLAMRRRAVRMQQCRVFQLGERLPGGQQLQRRLGLRAGGLLFAELGERQLRLHRLGQLRRRLHLLRGRGASPLLVQRELRARVFLPFARRHVPHEQ